MTARFIIFPYDPCHFSGQRSLNANIPVVARGLSPGVFPPNRVDKFYTPGMQTDGPIPIGPSGTILDVSFYRTSYGRKLAAYLMVPSGKKHNFQKGVMVQFLYYAVKQPGLLVSCRRSALSLERIGLVVFFIAIKIIAELHPSVLYGHTVRHPVQRCLYQSPVGLVDISFAEHLVDPFQPLAGLGEEHGSANGAVQTVGNSHEHLACLAVSLGDKSLEGFAQRLIPSLVSLDDLPASLVEDQEVIVFKQYP